MGSPVTLPPGFQIESAPSAPPLPPGFHVEQSEPEGAFSRFVSSVTSQLPTPSAIMGGIKEWWNRPEEIGHAMDALHVLNKAASLPENKGKPPAQWKSPAYTDEEKAVIERGLNANLGSVEGQHPMLAPTVQATGQALRGDVAGAAGTLVGGYGVPAAAAAVVPAVQERASNLTQRANVGTARALMKSAIKPGVADAPTLADVRQLTDTALQHGIEVNEAGSNKLQALIADYGQKTQAAIDRRTSQGMTVDPNAVAARLDQVNTTSALPEKAIATVNKAKEAFLARKGVRPAGPPTPTGLVDASGQPIMRPGTPANPGNPIPFDVAQAEKQGSYRNAKNAYGELSNDQVEAEKALARGFKEELEAKAPELKLLNEKESQFLGLQPALERAVRRAGNQDVAGLKDLAAAGAGGVAAGPAGAALGFTARLLDYPGLKSKLAIAINKASQKTAVPLTMAQSSAKAASILGVLGGAAGGVPSSVPSMPVAVPLAAQNQDLRAR